MLKVLHQIEITPTAVKVDKNNLPVEESGYKMLTELYRKEVNDYPKFFKMDTLCRLGFIASELLLKAESAYMNDTDNRAVIFFNKSASMCNDKNYQMTIEGDNYFPSPALFVYTLPNIVTGEIAIRNKYYGETSFYVLPEKDRHLIELLIEGAFADDATESVIAGWLECVSDDDFYADIRLYVKTLNN